MSDFLKPQGWQPSAQGHAPVGKSDIDSSYVRDGAFCNTHVGAPGCDILDPPTRARLVNDTQAAMGNAYSAFLSACTQVRVDEALKKPEDLSALGSLVIEALGGLAGMAISRAIKGLRSNPQAALTEVVGRIGVEHADFVRAANESNVNLIIDGATSVAKKAVSAGTSAAKSGVKSTRSEEVGEDRKVADGFVEHLEQAGAEYFESVRKNMLGKLNDPDMILFYRSWDVSNGHSTPKYKASIEAKLQKFRSSNASKIGRTEAGRHLGPPGNLMKGGAEHLVDEADEREIDRAADIRDTKLVLHIYDNEVRPSLYYYRRDYHGGIQRMPGGERFMDPRTNLDELAKSDWTMYGEVEPDLVDAAMATNERVWGVKYEPKIVQTPSFSQRGRTSSSKKALDPTPSPTPASTTPSVPTPDVFDISKHNKTGNSLPASKVGQDLPDLQSPVMPVD